MNSKRFTVVVAAAALTALMSISWLTMPDLVEAKSLAPVTDYSHISAPGGPVLYTAERGVAIVDYSLISASGGPLLYSVESSNLDRSGKVESIPARMTDERIREEQDFAARNASVESIPGRVTEERMHDELNFAARTLSAGGASTAIEAGIPYSEYLRATELGAPEMSSVNSTSDILRDAHLGASAPAAFESTSDRLRDEHLGPLGNLAGR